MHSSPTPLLNTPLSQGSCNEKEVTKYKRCEIKTNKSIFLLFNQSKMFRAYLGILDGVQGGGVIEEGRVGNFINLHCTSTFMKTLRTLGNHPFG